MRHAGILVQLQKRVRSICDRRWRHDLPQSVPGFAVIAPWRLPAQALN
jgi:hypothetical protein